MPWSLDLRIPVCLGTEADIGDDDAALTEGPLDLGVVVESFEAEHAVGCACCGARSPAAVALDRLFQQRVRGQVAFFKRVVAITQSPEGMLAVWAAVRSDPVASARYRLVDRQTGTS